MTASRLVVAIDGPAGSGKSTTARLVAEKLGFLYLDTGAMYRALTWKVQSLGIDPRNEAGVARVAESTTIEIVRESGEARILVDGEDVTGRLRDSKISRDVSWVARVPPARRVLVAGQRKAALEGDVVVEGRDIGTVVFPDAAVKIYLDASLEERAKRRLRELGAAGSAISLEETIRDIRARDALDSERDHSPLRRAADAVLLDTTSMSIEEQVDAVVRIVRQALGRTETEREPRS
jgi:cytidylate kinase